MKTLEYHSIDKSTWDLGPWDTEPDKIQYPDPDTGMPCLIVRNPNGGALCGYVGVDENHPLFGLGGDELECHGGVTFTGLCREGAEEHGICHIPGEGEPDKVWWFGFDCAHYSDRTPAMEAHLAKLGHHLRIPGLRYRTVAYVKKECADLAKQLKNWV